VSQFQATKCDECGRIQGEVNHWVRVQVWLDHNNSDLCYGVTLGDIVGDVMGTGNFTMAKPVVHDLCGQGCAMKHIAKLLGWSQVNEASA
jgi:hypothetical protein